MVRVGGLFAFQAMTLMPRLRSHCLTKVAHTADKMTPICIKSARAPLQCGHM